MTKCENNAYNDGFDAGLAKWNIATFDMEYARVYAKCGPDCATCYADGYFDGLNENGHEPEGYELHPE